jgi:hypothetical protein
MSSHFFPRLFVTWTQQLCWIKIVMANGHFCLLIKMMMAFIESSREVIFPKKVRRSWYLRRIDYKWVLFRSQNLARSLIATFSQETFISFLNFALPFFLFAQFAIAIVAIKTVLSFVSHLSTCYTLWFLRPTSISFSFSFHIHLRLSASLSS